MPNYNRPVFWFTALPTVILHAPLAYATHYLDIAQAQYLMFPDGEIFSEVNYSDNGAHKVWRVEHKGKLAGYFFVDDVIGKHEYITYALAISADGAIKQIEILDYRETKGGQVIDPVWRDQFKNKTSKDALEVGTDISNISGATLSCKHVTAGVRRLIDFYERRLKSPV